MKKLLEVSAIIAFIAILFAGCSSPASDSPSSPASEPSSTQTTETSSAEDEILTEAEEILFDKELATEDTTAITLSDGNWVLTSKTLSYSTATLEKTEFTISNKGQNIKYTSKITIKYNDETKKIKSKVETPSSTLSNLGGSTVTSSTIIFLRKDFYKLATHKTNSTNTKYYATGNKELTISGTTFEEVPMTIYLMKK